MRALRNRGHLIATAAMCSMLMHCGDDDSHADGDPWADCGGARGAKLTCNSFRARHVAASRYDSKRHCFEPSEKLSDLCAVPTYCPGGGGELTCFVSSGKAYAAYVLYGEEFSDSGWHHDINDVLDSTLTANEQPLCDALQNELRSAADDADAGSVFVDMGIGAGYRVGPPCSD